MKSLKYLYKIGRGPSSSHTMGPDKAARYFKERNSDADSYKVILYGSLAKMGKGHRCDYVLNRTVRGYKLELIFDRETMELEGTIEMGSTPIIGDGYYINSVGGAIVAQPY